MQMVITIEEDNHGLIGIAKNYSSAIDFLIDEDWLDGNYELYNANADDDSNVKTVKEDLGEEWKEVILSWDTETFNNYFDCCFYLVIEEVYGT